MISKDILTRLQNGEKAEDIANELINALNDANIQFQKEEEAKKAAAEALKGKELQKKADMQNILDLMHDFCIDYYCDNNEDIDIVEEAFKELTAETVISMIEEAGAVALDMEKKLKDIEQLFGAAPIKATSDKSADAVINSFLKSIGL